MSSSAGQAAASAYTSHVVAEEKRSGVIDQRYVKGIPGLMKLLEGVFSLIGFICVTASATVCLSGLTTPGFFKFITMACFVLTLLVWIMLLLKLQTRIFRCNCINWPFVEFVFYAGLVVLLFFGSLFMALHSCHIAHRAGCAFGFLALVVYCVDFFFALRVWLASRKARGEASTATPATPGIDDPKY